MASRTCTAIVDPRTDGECGEPAHLETGRCPEHLPEAEPPKVVRSPSKKGVFDVGVFCTCLQRWHWAEVKAIGAAHARVLATNIIARMYRESGDRWDLVVEQAKKAGKAQRRKAQLRAHLVGR